MSIDHWLNISGDVDQVLIEMSMNNRSRINGGLDWHSTTDTFIRDPSVLRMQYNLFKWQERKQKIKLNRSCNRNNSDLLAKLSSKMKPVLVTHVGQHKLINCETLSKTIKQKWLFMISVGYKQPGLHSGKGLSKLSLYGGQHLTSSMNDAVLLKFY